MFSRSSAIKKLFHWQQERNLVVYVNVLIVVLQVSRDVIFNQYFQPFNFILGLTLDQSGNFELTDTSSRYEDATYLNINWMKTEI